MEWTEHAKGKMRFYGISEQMVKKVLREPKRLEKGVAPGTNAAMLPYGKPPKGRKQPYRGEVWVMFKKLKIISVWRYPGVSPMRGEIPVPPDIQKELQL